MILFYTTDNTESEATLHDQEARHCSQVLRKVPGDIIQWIDGKGTFYSGELIESRKDRCRIIIKEKIADYGKRPYFLEMAVAPTKQMNRYEWFIEKSVEIGVDAITPIICDHSERRKVRVDRLDKIALSATKQSLKAYLPAINEPVSFQSFVSGLASTTRNQFIAHQHTDARSLTTIYNSGSDVIICIGPEGDFSPAEVQTALDSGFNILSLGTSRLRTETAAVAACHGVYFMNQ